MGITQHRDAVDGVRAIVNVGLARGNVGRDGAGLMPIRGHSGVQGGAEMGAYATALPRRRRRSTPSSAAALGERSGASPCPTRPGRTAPEMVEAAGGRRARRALDARAATSSRSCPTRRACGRRCDRVPLRVHQDVVLTSQMLVEGDDVLLLPVATRYEQEGGGTETTTERRIVFSPEIPRQVGEARSEWRLFADVAARVRPELAGAFAWADNQALRAEIAEVVPAYAGIETLADHRRPGAVGRPPPLRRRRVPHARRPGALHRARAGGAATCRPGAFTVATRRGKQFNSMVHAEVDPLTGAGRDAVYIDEADAAALGAAEGTRVRLTSATGTLRRPLQARAAPGALAAGALARGQRAHRRRAPSQPRARLARSPTTTRSSPSRCSTSASG